MLPCYHWKDAGRDWNMWRSQQAFHTARASGAANRFGVLLGESHCASAVRMWLADVDGSANHGGHVPLVADTELTFGLSQSQQHLTSVRCTVRKVKSQAPVASALPDQNQDIFAAPSLQCRAVHATSPTLAYEHDFVSKSTTKVEPRVAHCSIDFKTCSRSANICFACSCGIRRSSYSRCAPIDNSHNEHSKMIPRASMACPSGFRGPLYPSHLFDTDVSAAGWMTREFELRQAAAASSLNREILRKPTFWNGNTCLACFSTSCIASLIVELGEIESRNGYSHNVGPMILVIS